MKASTFLDIRNRWTVSVCVTSRRTEKQPHWQNLASDRIYHKAETLLCQSPEQWRHLGRAEHDL
jgi:hypothetical protein